MKESTIQPCHNNKKGVFTLMQKITKIKPGLYPGLSNEFYHQSPGISKSGLSLILKSPLHYANKYLSDEPEPESTPAQIVGTALHTKVLEPDLFTYVLAPDVNRRTKAGKAEYAKFKDEHKGLILLKAEDMDLVTNMANAIFSNPTAKSLLMQGEGIAEESVYWIDDITKVLCKCRPDFRRYDGIVIDVKTAIDASPEAFGRAAFNFGYHQQAAFYLDGVSTATGYEHRTFIFIVVEKTPPFAVAIYILNEPESTQETNTTSALDIGRDDMAMALYRYQQCLGLPPERWPGYNPQIQPLEFPGWAFKRKN